MPNNRATPGAQASRGRRTAIFAILASLTSVPLLLVLYVAAARKLLSTDRLRELISSPSTHIDYDEAVSPWPGRLRIRNLRIRADDGNVQWFLSLREAEVAFSVAALLRKQFHATSVQGAGLSFRVRELRRPGERYPAPLSVIPPIPGFPREPLPSVPHRPATEAPSAWSVLMENISIERLEEIWIQIYRSRGDARLTGSFFLAPGREAEVGPAAIEFSSGDVRIGSETVLAGRRGRIECHIERYDIARFPGSAVWAVTSGSVSLSGHTPAVRFLNYFFRDSPVPRLSGGAGDLSLRGRIERGAAAGTARLSGRRISARTGPGEVRADADLTMGVRRWDLASGRVDLSQTRIRLADLESPGDRTSGWWGDFDVPSGTISGGIDVRVEAHCRDARPLFTLFGTTVPKLVRRPLELEDLTVTARVALASSFVRVRDLDARGGSTQVLGEYRRRGTRADGVFLIDAKPVPVAVALRDGKARVRPVGARRWFEREREEMFGDAETASQRARSTTTAVP